MITPPAVSDPPTLVAPEDLPTDNPMRHTWAALEAARVRRVEAQQQLQALETRQAELRAWLDQVVDVEPLEFAVRQAELTLLGRRLPLARQEVADAEQRVTEADGRFQGTYGAYAPGIMAFSNVLEAWRADGKLEGLVFN